MERWRISEAAPQITYSASVSPGLTESPGNPFEATYTYAAGAIATFGNTSIDLATIGKLPDGVLQFVSDGSLACTTDVGGEVAVGACTITYGSLGQHAVTARYVPDVATVNAPFETSAATLHSYWTATSQNIVREQGPPEPESGPDDAEIYIATYDVTADTVDQYGYASGALRWFLGVPTFGSRRRRQSLRNDDHPAARPAQLRNHHHSDALFRLCRPTDVERVVAGLFRRTRHRPWGRAAHESG